MTSDSFPYPVAVSRIGEQADSRGAQTSRAIGWLRKQSGGPIVVITPQKRLDSAVLEEFIGSPGVTHISWRGLNARSLAGHRVLHAWPTRKHLNDLGGVNIDALAVLEWEVVAEWIEDAQPDILLREGIEKALSGAGETANTAPLVPEEIIDILDYLAIKAAGYSSGLKRNEVEKLKADLMNRPDRWKAVTPQQVRRECKRSKISPNDVDLIVDLVTRRQQGKRFNLSGSSYKHFTFNPQR